MQKVNLYRIKTGDDGTFSALVAGTQGFGCFMVELPWRDNKSRISCIPDGDYEFHWIKSPSHGWCYEAKNVPGGRTHIQIHSANWAGDVSRGFKSQLLGCLAPGASIAKINGQKGVTSSRKTVAAFAEAMGKKPFMLRIRWALI